MRERFVERIHGRHQHEGNEELVAPQRMTERRTRDGRRAVVAMREDAMVEALASAHDAAVRAQRMDLRNRVLVARDRLGVDHRSHPVLAQRGIADLDFIACRCKAAVKSLNVV